MLKFSKKFMDDLARIKAKGFEWREANVNFVVHWKAEGTDKEVKIILPEIQFEKQIEVVAK